MPAVTYSAQKPNHGPTFECPRCARVYPFPQEPARPIRCECGWWYTNLGHGKFVEAFRPRIGGARLD